MVRTWPMQAKILTGIVLFAGYALPQAYTISAKPGAVSYIEGEVSVNGAPVASSALRAMFLSANDTLSTTAGKAEVLLTPGVFLRVGDDSQVRMIAPSLVNTQLEVVSGAAMIEVDQVVAGTTTAVMDHGSSTVLAKAGLYRFTASAQPTVAVLEGQAEVYFGSKKIDLKKGKQALLTDELAVSKLDLDKADELYAWSNVRAQYDSAVSYQGAKSVYDSGGFGYGSGYQTSGLYWNNPYNSWMWLPGNGAFYSPFGWGFYGPGLVTYAPVLGYGYGYLGGYGYGGYGYLGGAGHLPGKPVVYPINPKHPPVTNIVATSPAVYAAARQQMEHSIQSSGYSFRTATGAPAAVLSGGHSYPTMQAASRAASSSARSVSSSSGGGSTSSGSASSSAISSTPSVSARSVSSSGSSFGGGHSGGSSGGGHSSK